MKIKNIKYILLIVVITVLLVGCAECVETTLEDVEVIIVDVYHRSGYIQPIFIGKTVVTIPHPAVYQVTVEYDGTRYIVDDKTTYEKYHDRIGEFASAKLEIKKYDDGTVERDVVSIE